MAPDDSRTRPAQADPATMAAMRSDFLDFIDDEYHLVVRHLMRCGIPLECSKDATQEAFIEAWRLLSEEPDIWQQIFDRRRGWIRKVAHRAALRPPGQRQIQPLTTPIPEPPDYPDPCADHGELTTQTLYVLAALHGLQEDQRIVMAYGMDGFSAVEIAHLMGISDQKVRDLGKQAWKTLKTKLAPCVGQEGGTRR